MSRDGFGFTLIEVLAASVVATVVAGGVLTAFLVAARMPRRQGNEAQLEANMLAAQTLEWMRNQVATDTTFFADQAALGWQEDVPPPATTSESVLALGGERWYCVWAADCDGVGGAGDCYAAQVKVCWNGTPCPAAGAPCS